jgi:hypothetical protein
LARRLPQPTQPVVYLQRAGKYKKPAWRLSQ